MTTHADERCRACGGPVLPVLWGMPDVEVRCSETVDDDGVRLSDHPTVAIDLRTSH